MLYTNVVLRPQEKDGKYGVFFKTCRNDSHGLYLPVSKEILYNIYGMKRNLNIEIIDGAPTIVTKSCQDFYVLLATEHSTDSPNHGIFGTLRSQNVDFIGRRYFRDQGSEQFYIIKVKDQDVFRITWGDGCRGESSIYYLVHNKDIETTTEYDGAEELYQRLNLKMPFHYKVCQKNMRRIIFDEWLLI